MSTTPATPIVARASTEYRVKRYLIVVMLIGMGLWFGYDGFIGWPRENARIDQLKQEIAAARTANDEPKVRQLEAQLGKLEYRSGLSIRVQKVLAFTLPPLGLLTLVWALYNSRGTYRLEDDVLTVPGHPPVPLDAIRAIDKTDWDRKGIAYVDYELPTGPKGRLRLDDFIYERKPTDDIFQRIEDVTGTAESPAPANT